MADKGNQAKDNHKTESHSSADKQKPKNGNHSPDAGKGPEKGVTNQSKKTDDKKKSETHPTKGKKDDPKGDHKSVTDAESAESLLKTTPYDPRFPNQNQTRNCYQNYLDYHRCLKVKGSESYCHYYQWAYREICPKAWYEKWDDQRERGIFPGRI